MPDASTRVWPVADLRAFLSGSWQVDRSLRDDRLGVTGTFTGTAVFTPEAAGRLRYRERGTLRFGAHTGAAEQQHLYAFPAPHRAEVHFRDDRPFHVLDLRTGCTRVVHHCGADVYAGRFCVTGPGSWQVEWRVTGPRKDQHIRTRYRRLSA